MEQLVQKIYETDLYLNKWTNNNTESLNNLIKQEIDWKPQKTNDLIAKIDNLVKRKLLDLKLRLHLAGNWSLNRDYHRYAINTAKWNSKVVDWQQKEFENFLKDTKNLGKSESEIGKKYKGLGIAKKPGQTKRPVNVRTR